MSSSREPAEPLRARRAFVSTRPGRTPRDEDELRRARRSWWVLRPADPPTIAPRQRRFRPHDGFTTWPLTPSVALALFPAGQGGLGASARTASTVASSKAAASSIQDAFSGRVTLFSPSRRKARPSPLARKRRNESSRSHLPDSQAACAVVCDRSRGQGGGGPSGARRPLQPTTIRERVPLARSPEPRAFFHAPRGRPGRLGARKRAYQGYEVAFFALISRVAGWRRPVPSRRARKLTSNARGTTPAEVSQVRGRDVGFALSAPSPA